MKNYKNETTEYEVKFYPVIKNEYRNKLLKIGAVLVTPERKMRRTIVDGNLHPQFTCHYIRVRDEGNLVRLSAKIHAEAGGQITDQKEIDVEVSDYEKTIRIIESMGFVFSIYQETLRETWKYKDAEITIDTWPGLESYTEIEAGSAEDVRNISEKLGFKWSKRIITGIREVYMKVYSMPLEKVIELTNNISFDNNPFRDLKKKKV